MSEESCKYTNSVSITLDVDGNGSIKFTGNRGLVMHRVRSLLGRLEDHAESWQESVAVDAILASRQDGVIIFGTLGSQIDAALKVFRAKDRAALVDGRDYTNGDVCSCLHFAAKRAKDGSDETLHLLTLGVHFVRCDTCEKPNRVSVSQRKCWHCGSKLDLTNARERACSQEEFDANTVPVAHFAS